MGAPCWSHPAIAESLSSIRSASELKKANLHGDAGCVASAAEAERPSACAARRRAEDNELSVGGGLEGAAPPARCRSRSDGSARRAADRAAKRGRDLSMRCGARRTTEAAPRRPAELLAFSRRIRSRRLSSGSVGRRSTWRITGPTDCNTTLSHQGGHSTERGAAPAPLGRASGGTRGRGRSRRQGARSKR